MKNTDLSKASSEYDWDKRGLDLFHEKYVLPFIGSNILNLGCGPNNELDHYIYFKLKKLVTSVDVNKDFIINRKNPALVSSADDLPFDDNSFDTTILIDVLEHCKDDAKALSECIRVTKKRIILTVPNHSHELEKYMLIYKPWIDRTHYRHYTRDSIENLFAKFSNISYKVKEINTIGFFSIFLASTDIASNKLNYIPNLILRALNKASQPFSPFKVTIYSVIDIL